MDGPLHIHTLTGAWPVYPGHPLVVALQIIHVYPDFEAAAAPTEYGWAKAVGDQRIAGAGDHVRAGVEVLGKGHKGATLNAMLEYARSYWESSKAGGHQLSIEPGAAQAAALEGHFRSVAAQWLKGVAA